MQYKYSYQYLTMAKILEYYHNKQYITISEFKITTAHCTPSLEVMSLDPTLAVSGMLVASHREPMEPADPHCLYNRAATRLPCSDQLYQIRLEPDTIRISRHNSTILFNQDVILLN